MYDVIVVGAGPSGSYTAYLLAKDGYRVLLLERCVAKNKLCTGVISDEAFEAFDLGRGSILKSINSVRFLPPSGEGFQYRHMVPFAHIVNRDALDASMLEKAIKGGVEFYQGIDVKGLTIVKECVRVTYEHENHLQEASCNALVLAVGLNRHLLRMVGLTPPDYIMGAQAEVDFEGEQEVHVFLGNKIAPGSFAWLVPLGNGRAKIGLSTKKRARIYFNRLLKVPVIRNGLGSMTNPEVGLRPIPYGVMAKSYCERGLVVGDAAGQVKSTTGGGIYYGLLGAETAYQTLKDAFSKGCFGEEELRLYEERWKERLSPEIETGLKLRELFSTLDDQKIDCLVNLARSDGIAQLIQSQAKFDWHRGFFQFLLKRADIAKILGKGIDMVNGLLSCMSI